MRFEFEMFGRTCCCALPERHSSADIIRSWDTACKEGGQNDYSVCSTWLHRDHNYYLVDVVRGRFDYPSLRDVSISHARLHKPGTLLVEDSGVGTALTEELQRAGLPAIAVKPKGSKITRMSVECGKFASGQVFLPKDAPWLAEFESEI